MKKDTRAPGDKRPPKETKSLILMFLTNGKRERSEIQDMLEDKHNIRAVKTIINHLDDLEAKNLIEVSRKGPGVPNIYSIPSSFQGFVSVFNYLGKDKRSRLLSSPYGQQMICDNFLREFVREMIMFNMEPDEGKKSCDNVEEIYPSLDDLIKIILKSIKRQEEVTSLKSHNDVEAEQKHRSFSDIVFNVDYGTESIFPSRFAMHFMLMFPPKERQEIIGILQTSPTAMSFLLNAVTMDGRIQRRVICMYPYSMAYSLEEESRSFSEADELKIKEIEAKMISSAREISENLTKPTALLQILRGQLLLDVVEGNVNWTPMASDIYWGLSSDEVELGEGGQ